MTQQAIPADVEIIVTGKDMFGASFCEKTRLINLAKDKFSFSLFRPVSEKRSLRVNFHPDRPHQSYWVNGVVFNVRHRLDGMQTVEVRVSGRKGQPT